MNNVVDVHIDEDISKSLRKTLYSRSSLNELKKVNTLASFRRLVDLYYTLPYKAGLKLEAAGRFNWLGLIRLHRGLWLALALRCR